RETLELLEGVAVQPAAACELHALEALERAQLAQQIAFEHAAQARARQTGSERAAPVAARRGLEVGCALAAPAPPPRHGVEDAPAAHRRARLGDAPEAVQDEAVALDRGYRALEAQFDGAGLARLDALAREHQHARAPFGGSQVRGQAGAILHRRRA